MEVVTSLCLAVLWCLRAPQVLCGLSWKFCHGLPSSPPALCWVFALCASSLVGSPPVFGGVPLPWCGVAVSGY